MSDSRRSMALWGAVAVLLLAAALLTASVFTGLQNSVPTNVIASVITVVFVSTGCLCAVQAARAYALNLLGALSQRVESHLEEHVAKRLEKHLAVSDAKQERRQVALLTAVSDSREAVAEAVAKHGQLLAAQIEVQEEQTRAAGSLARSQRLQTESISLIRKQTRAILEDLEGKSAEGSSTLAIATEGRDMSRKLLNLVRAGARETHEKLKPVAPALHALSARTGDVEAGQRRAMNYLRKDGNIQIVLDKLVAAERRLVASVESSALTGADELSSATSARIATLHGELASLQDEIGELKSRTDDVNAGVVGLAPQFDLAAGSVGALRDDVTTLRAETEEVRTAVREFAPQLSEKVDVISARMDSTKNDDEATTELQRELIAGVRSDFQGLDEALRTVIRLSDTTKTDVKGLGRRVDRAGLDVVRQVESLLQLLARVDTSARRFPASGGFAMNPDGLLLLSDLVRRRKPKKILEIGSGTSTVWMATFAASVNAQLISVDHLEEYRKITLRSLRDFGLEAQVDLRLAELAEVEIGGETTKWYNADRFADLYDIDMVIVDGPPESTGPNPRFPAFPLLRDKLSPGALIVVDDLHREQETQMVEKWLEQCEDLSRTLWSAGRTGVLEYKGAPATRE